MQKRVAGTRSWMVTGCALALIWACASPRAAFAQADSAGAATSKASGDAVKPETKSNTAAATHKSNAKRSSSHKKGKRKTSARGQQKIDPQRAQEIQEALIREHYLSGDAAGTWNQASEDAMRRYRADHGWQSKMVPDSRALISLGLGPSHDHLLNPESAMTTGPFPMHGEPVIPTSHSAEPASSSAVKPTASDPAATSTPIATPAHDAPNPQ